ncbi:MAG: MBL fold metallo-hydrolase [Candidatus Diapherotrites archaeon]|nr:MBL fold metallo-hydrolase [Candidatus Diapherotrites archaeon]
MGKLEFRNVSFELLGHDSAKISGSKTVCIDPFRIAAGFKADIIVVTHEHFDHLSLQDIAKISSEKTKIVCAKSCAAKIGKNASGLSAGESIEIAGARISAVEAYNTNKKFHPKGLGIGVVIEMDGIRVYHAGDTDFIPEMSGLENIDVAFLPVSGTYVMTAEEAAKAAETIRPKIAVPMHYASIVGSAADAEKFKKLYSGRTEILGK